MKQVIRRSVFETNSSSMHSIAISKVNGKYTDEEVYESFKYYDKHYGRKKDLHIQFLNDYMKDKEATCFGRSPFRILSTFCDKLRYYIASRSNIWEDADYTKFLNHIMERYSRIKSFEFTKTPECEKEYTDNIYDYGYIDHESREMLFSFLLKKNIDIDEFLTNRKYIIFVDGDEYAVSTHLVKSNILELEEPLFMGGDFSYVN